MEFQLPSNLQQHLIKYDPVLKKTAQTGKPVVSRNSIGIPDDMIPTHIISKQRLLEAITYIASVEISKRYFVFTTIKQMPDGTDYREVKAILYHVEKLWVAAWLPNPGEDYIYGISFAFKAAHTNHITRPYDLFDMDTVSNKKYGRTNFHTYTDYITRTSIAEGKNTAYWLHNIKSYKEKLAHIKPAIKNFTEQLKETIPHWHDAHEGNLFNRINPKTNNYISILRLPSDSPPVPGVELCRSYLNYKNKHILDKPWFKRYINTESQKIIDAFHDPDTASPDVLRDKHEKIKETLAWINKILEIWPDCPIDYLQTAISNNVFYTLTIHSLYYSNYSKDLLHAWLNTHLPVESFFKIITKYTEEWLSKCANSTNATKYNARFDTLRDTISMLDKILSAGETIDPPKRWRIEEFHDHIQTKAWTIDNPNHDLPQDLFPTPIKVLHQECTWTFFQPKDTHQLSQWGQAVRNCVGTASSYADNVKAKKIFIVLCMQDNKPLFTVLLKVANGLMSADQIVGLSNASLSIEDKEQYTKIFAQALKQREEELKL